MHDELLRQKRLVEDLVAEATRKQIADKGAFVKKAFSPTLDLSALDERIVTVTKQEMAKKEAKHDIYYQFDEHIKTKERKVSKATLTVYSNVKGHCRHLKSTGRKKLPSPVLILISIMTLLITSPLSMCICVARRY